MLPPVLTSCSGWMNHYNENIRLQSGSLVSLCLSLPPTRCAGWTLHVEGCSSHLITIIIYMRVCVHDHRESRLFFSIPNSNKRQINSLKD